MNKFVVNENKKKEIEKELREYKRILFKDRKSQIRMNRRKSSLNLENKSQFKEIV